MPLIIKSFIAIRISVENVAKSRDWYKSFFGVEPIEDIENFVSFNIAQVNFDISLADEKSPLSTGGSVGYWLVDDLDKSIARAIELGGQIYRGPLRVEETQRKIVQIIDPYGNVFGLESGF